mmetsp:Transcript_8146/g.21007  ORF Transcript_8146/g.21007 Transcript_8146/m.21007 type:complete len:430 (-) Transcript_8146:17-1306(-)
MVVRIGLAILVLSTLCPANSATGVLHGFIGYCPPGLKHTTSFVGTGSLEVATARHVAARALTGRGKADAPLLSLRGAVNSGGSGWVWAVLEEADGTRSSTTRLMCAPGCPVFDVDAVKEVAKLKFAAKLRDVDATDLDVTVDEGGSVLEEDVLMSGLSNGRTKADPLLIRAPKPVAAKVIRYLEEDIDDPNVVRVSFVSINGQQAFDNWLRNMQVGSLSCDSNGGRGTMNFQELDEGVVYQLQTGTPVSRLSRGMARLIGWRENQDRALEDEVTRFVWTHENTSHAPLTCRPDLREVNSTVENHTFEWDGVLCNGKDVIVVEAKQNVFVNMSLHPTTGQDTSYTDTVTAVVGKWKNFTKALHAGELEHFEDFQHCEVRLFLGARNFAREARDVCTDNGVYAVYPSGSNFQLAAPSGKTPGTALQSSSIQ